MKTIQIKIQHPISGMCWISEKKEYNEESLNTLEYILAGLGGLKFKDSYSKEVHIFSDILLKQTVNTIIYHK